MTFLLNRILSPKFRVIRFTFLATSFFGSTCYFFGGKKHKFSVLSELKTVTETQEVTKNKKCIVVGMSAVDIIGKSNQKLITGTSNIGKVSMMPGGVARNIVECLSRLGDPPIFISIVGNDNFGKYLKDHMTEELNLNVDFIEVSPDRPTAVYHALLDSDGDTVAAVNDMEIIDTIDPVKMRANIQPVIGNSRMIVFDANLSGPCLVELCHLAKEYNVPTFFNPTSVPKALKIVQENLLDSITYITPNAMEVKALAQAIDPTIDLHSIESCSKVILRAGVKNVIVTQGPNPVLMMNNQTTQYFEPIKPTQIINTTGAGDSLSAGIIYSLGRDSSIQTAITTGLWAAKYSIESAYAINPKVCQLPNKQIEDL